MPHRANILVMLALASIAIAPRAFAGCYERASKDYTRAGGIHYDAQLEEEAGRYREAAKHYAEAAKIFSTNCLAEKAVYYWADLGRLRSLRKLGREKEWSDGCDGWRSRLLALRWNVFTRPLNREFGGVEIAEADWEMSCGSFARGLDLVEREMRRRIGRVDSERAQAPFVSLRMELKARGQGTLGDEAYAIGLRLESAASSADLQGILKSALDLMARCRAAVRVS